MPGAWTTTLLPELLSRFFAERTSLNVWQWCEAGNVYLDEQMSPGNPGPYNSELTPYTRFLQEWATDQYGPSTDLEGTGETFREFIGMKSSQVGFSEGYLNICRWTAANRPRNILYALDSQQEAKKISNVRLKPSLRKIVEGLSDDEDKLGTLTIYLLGMVIYLLGSYTAGGFANKPVWAALLDELDLHQPNPNGEAETIDLARDRLKTVEDGKLAAISKPIFETGVTFREYRTGSRHKYFVPCPHCGHMQELVLEQLKFAHCKDAEGNWELDRVLTETFYECEATACRLPIHENHKRAMLLKGQWRRTNFDKGEFAAKPGKISVHISDFYSQFADAAWGKLAVEWIDSQTSLAKLKKFRNSRQGLPWKTQQAEVQEDDVLRLRGTYKRGTCPVVPCIVTLTSDKQADVFKWTKAAWEPDGTCYVVDYGFSLTADELIIKADEPVLCGLERLPMVAKTGLIDEGYQTTEIRNFCQAHFPRFHPSKGRGGIQVKQVVGESKTPHNGAIIIVYHYDDDDFKKQLYIQRIKGFKPAKPGQPAPVQTVPRLWLPSDIEPVFIAELKAEKLVEEKNAWGFSKFVWEKTGDNDFGDAVKMQFVTWYIIAPYFAAAPRIPLPAEPSEPQKV